MNLDINKDEDKCKVVLVGLCTNNGQQGSNSDASFLTSFEHAMEELKNLAEACNKEVVFSVTQRMDYPHKAYYVGPGKVNEIKEICEKYHAQEVIFDHELTPSQLRNLQQILEIPILDRTLLILEIFATRARSKEAMLQVEVARLQYMLPRLVGLHQELGRQGGASGSMSNKGSGEKKIELDRRRIEHRITQLKKELKEVEKNRETQRKRRVSSDMPQVSLVGYTNAGKSTIMNHMLALAGGEENKKVFEKDMLFATLDTSVRALDFGNKKPFYLTDTVGFVSDLPSGLVEAFHSTLEEVKYADLLLQVVDCSDEHYKEQMKITEDTLKEINAADIPMVIVYNKADLTDYEYPACGEKYIRVSARDEESIQKLMEYISAKIYLDFKEYNFLIPYSDSKSAAYLIQNAKIIQKSYEEEGVRIQAEVSDRIFEQLKEYLCE